MQCIQNHWPNLICFQRKLSELVDLSRCSETRWTGSKRGIRDGSPSTRILRFPKSSVAVKTSTADSASIRPRYECRVPFKSCDLALICGTLFSCRRSLLGHSQSVVASMRLPRKQSSASSETAISMLYHHAFEFLDAPGILCCSHMIAVGHKRTPWWLRGSRSDKGGGV